MLEQMICGHLQNSGELAAKLAVYDGKPAVFDYREPTADDPKWQGEERYGRIVLSLQIRDDPGRARCGSLTADIQSESQTQFYKEMEPIVRNCLDGYFFASKDQLISLKWIHRSPGRESLASVCEGVTLHFQVYTYPVKGSAQVTPASLLSRWCRAFMESMGRPAYYLGDSDSLPAVFKPTAERPALYWRLIQTGPCSWIKDMPAADWRTVTLQGHIIAPGQREEEALLALRFDQAIERAGRIACDEMSLLVSKEDGVDLTADSMKQGQLTVKAAWGIPSEAKTSQKLQNVFIEMN